MSSTKRLDKAFRNSRYFIIGIGCMQRHVNKSRHKIKEGYDVYSDKFMDVNTQEWWVKCNEDKVRAFNGAQMLSIEEMDLKYGKPSNE